MFMGLLVFEFVSFVGAYFMYARFYRSEVVTCSHI